jgi:hypothetical protein
MRSADEWDLGERSLTADYAENADDLEDVERGIGIEKDRFGGGAATLGCLGELGRGNSE